MTLWLHGLTLVAKRRQRGRRFRENDESRPEDGSKDEAQSNHEVEWDEISAMFVMDEMAD